MSDSELRERQAMNDVSERLSSTLSGTYSDETIRRTLGEVYGRFDGKPIRDFVPILVERFTRQELARGMARHDDPV